MTQQQHDRNLILEEEGDAPLAPSCMRYLDASLDMNATFRKFWDVMDSHYAMRGYADTRNRAYKVAGLCDSVTLNLIATHYGQGLSLSQIDSILVEGHGIEDIRRHVLMRLSVVGSDQSVFSSVSLVNNSKFAALKKYPLTTDEGFSAQRALVTLLAPILVTSNRMLRHKVLGGYLLGGFTWFTDDELAVYTLENSEKVDLIISTIFERNTADVSVIREVLSSDALALSVGAL